MFGQAIHNLKVATKERYKSKASLPFGIPYLDCATGGILNDDLVIVTARTGSGKTEMATIIAQACLESGKTVSFFALEAYKGEIESRLMFKILAEAFFTQKNFRSFERYPNYHDWRRGINNDLTQKFEEEATKEFEKKYVNLHTCYRENNFTPDDFEKKIDEVWSFTDIIILDHLHYFDFDSDNENAAMKSCIKRIRVLSQSLRKPIILVAHLRKKDKFLKSIVPDTEEIHGSSDIGKIATMIVSSSPAFDQSQSDKFIFPTYLRLCKNRDDSSRTRFVGLAGFNIQKNTYEQNFALGKLSLDESEFLVTEGEWPQWARRDRKV
jgi:KaiC/GvpD/RAD55 family RecA-like ATPase